MCFDFLTDSFHGSDIYIKGKETEDFFLIFQNIFSCVLTTCIEYRLLKFTLVLKTLKNYY